MSEIDVSMSAFYECIERENEQLKQENEKFKQKLEKIRQVHQWILDQWDLDTKEVQDKILKLIESKA